MWCSRPFLITFGKFDFHSQHLGPHLRTFRNGALDANFWKLFLWIIVHNQRLYFSNNKPFPNHLFFCGKIWKFVNNLRSQIEIVLTTDDAWSKLAKMLSYLIYIVKTFLKPFKSPKNITLESSYSDFCKIGKFYLYGKIIKFKNSFPSSRQPKKNS